MLEILMMFIMMHRANPQYKVVDQPGQYFEIVKTAYDSKKNQTYAVFQRYGLDVKGQNPYLLWMQPRPFPGKPTELEMLKTVEHDNYVTIVGLK